MYFYEGRQTKVEGFMLVINIFRPEFFLSWHPLALDIWIYIIENVDGFALSIITIQYT
jgi:hypothetical protein